MWGLSGVALPKIRGGEEAPPTKRGGRAAKKPHPPAQQSPRPPPPVPACGAPRQCRPDTDRGADAVGRRGPQPDSTDLRNLKSPLPTRRSVKARSATLQSWRRSARGPPRPWKRSRKAAFGCAWEVCSAVPSGRSGRRAAGRSGGRAVCRAVGLAAGRNPERGEGERERGERKRRRRGEGEKEKEEEKKGKGQSSPPGCSARRCRRRARRRRRHGCGARKCSRSRRRRPRAARSSRRSSPAQRGAQRPRGAPAIGAHERCAERATPKTLRLVGPRVGMSGDLGAPKRHRKMGAAGGR